MTAPLVLAEVDLRDFAYMPLDVLRLRDSDLSAEATDAEFRAAVMLWCAAWHQVPAASLPDNDAVLTRLCGLGRDVAGWQAIRSGALRGWVKCDDGRLYHPVVAEKANEAWEQRQNYRERLAKARAAKADKHSGNPPAVTETVIEPVTGLKGSERNGTDLREERIEATPLVAADAAPFANVVQIGRKPNPERAQTIRRMGEWWNDLASSNGLRQIDRIEGGRETTALSRARRLAEDFGSLDAGLAALGAKIRGSPFLKGATGWRGCTFDWTMKAGNFQKIFEDNYDGEIRTKRG